MYIGHGRLCPSLTAFPHYCTDPNITWGMVGVPSSCALLGGFAICARISLLRQQSAEREMSASACTRSVPVWMIYALTCRYFPPHLRCCHLVHLTLSLRWLCKVGFAMFLDFAQHNCWYINIIAFYLLQSIASSASVGPWLLWGKYRSSWSLRPWLTRWRCWTAHPNSLLSFIALCHITIHSITEHWNNSTVEVRYWCGTWPVSDTCMHAWSGYFKYKCKKI